MTYVPNDLLGRLVGCRLYSVQFVMDYVQLRFDRETSSETPVLNCYAWPTVTIGGARRDVIQVGWADALRSFIPQTVTGTREATGIGLLIDLESGSIGLHPTRDELDGAEIAELTGFLDNAWMVWRPGEDSFEDL